MSSAARQRKRRGVLEASGATAAEIDELLCYNENAFHADPLVEHLRLPLADEPHIEVWREYAERAERAGAFEVLRSVLPQLNFPVREGISDNADYIGATRKGRDVTGMEAATGLQLEEPRGMRLSITASPAGHVPVLLPATRADFVVLLQALSMRNEPDTVYDTQGAVTIGGYNNWDRVRRYRERWLSEHPFDDWAEEFARLVPHKERYQDRFIILSVGGYGQVAARDLGLADDEWRELSLSIRMHHECTHYFTWRLFGSMRNRALDEILADYMGMVASTGSFRTEWAQRFFGVHGFPRHQVGRLRRYRGNPPLSDGAFAVLHGLVYAALRNLGAWDAGLQPADRTVAGRAVVLLALASLTVEELAADDAATTLDASLARARLRTLQSGPYTGSEA